MISVSRFVGTPYCALLKLCTTWKYRPDSLTPRSKWLTPYTGHRSKQDDKRPPAEKSKSRWYPLCVQARTALSWKAWLIDCCEGCTPAFQAWMGGLHLVGLSCVCLEYNKFHSSNAHCTKYSLSHTLDQFRSGCIVLRTIDLQHWENLLTFPGVQYSGLYGWAAHTHTWGDEQ